VASTEAPPKRVRNVLAKTWSSSGALIAVIASGVALVFTLKPSLAPDPGAGLVASVAIQTVEPGVNLTDFDKRFRPTDVAGDAGPAGTPPLNGDIVWVRVDVKGVKHGHVNLYTVPYDAATRRPTFLREAIYQTTHNARGFDPGTPDDQWVAPLWVPNPGMPYFVRVMLERDHVILAYADTRPIAGR
jgi:hypothetical protein